MNKLAGHTVVRFLIVAGTAALVWAVIGLFWTVRTTTLTGTLDSGKAYTTTYSTAAYNTLDGWLTLLAALVCLAVSVRMFQKKFPVMKGLVWSGYVAVLLLGGLVAGWTTIINWLSWIPAEIQHGIGSPYVKMVQTSVSNPPLLIAKVFIIAFILTVFFAAFADTRKHGDV